MEGGRESIAKLIRATCDREHEWQGVRFTVGRPRHELARETLRWLIDNGTSIQPIDGGLALDFGARPATPVDFFQNLPAQWPLNVETDMHAGGAFAILDWGYTPLPDNRGRIHFPTTATK
jgi:hypothetical protein